MTTSIREIVSAIRTYAGVLRKQPIGDVCDILGPTQHYGTQLANYGDDAAVIPWQDGYLLLAADGMMTRLLVNEPYAAGKASVMVTVNDIYSMGGRPVALVNVLASGDEDQRLQIVRGIEKGCRKLRVPMVGGHLHPDAPEKQPALERRHPGQCQKGASQSSGRPGGRPGTGLGSHGRAGCHSVISWDANSGKTPDELVDRLEVMPQIAERELAFAAKDISNAGIVGTIAIMMENSGVGAGIDLGAIPKPRPSN